jgi:hypothetical protein
MMTQELPCAFVFFVPDAAAGQEFGANAEDQVYSGKINHGKSGRMHS